MGNHGIHYSVGLVVRKRHQNKTCLNLKGKKPGGVGGVRVLFPQTDCARFGNLGSQNGF